MSKLRLGVIGAGAWTVYSHLPELAKRRDVLDFVAVNRLGRDELERVQSAFGFQRASEDYRDILAESLDVCVVASPAGMHHEHAKAALEAGCHVLVEKPFTLRVDDAWDLVETARRTQRHLVVAFGYNYLPAVLRFQEALREVGGIGELESCQLTMASCTRELLTHGGSYPEVGTGDVPPPDPATWTDPALSGGGYAQAQLTHVLGLALPLLGCGPSQVTSIVHATGGTGIDTHDAATLRFGNGAVGSLAGSSSWTGVDASRDLVTLRAFGSDGQWLLDLDAERAYVFRRGDDAERELPMGPGSGNYDCVGPPHALVDLALGRPGAVNRSDGVLAARTVEVLDAFYRSASSGVAQSVAARTAAVSPPTASACEGLV